MRLNLTPAFLLARAAMPRLVERGGGAFVCVSARAALRPFPGAAGYVTSKAAVLAFVKALDAEYRDDGVRCNAVLPSVIDTPANREGCPTPTSRSGCPRPRSPGDPLPRLRRVDAGQRRRRAGLRPRLIPAVVGRALSPSSLVALPFWTAPIGAPIKRHEPAG